MQPTACVAPAGPGGWRWGVQVGAQFWWSGPRMEAGRQVQGQTLFGIFWIKFLES